MWNSREGSSNGSFDFSFNALNTNLWLDWILSVMDVVGQSDLLSKGAP